MFEHFESLFLDLPDSFPGNVKTLSDLLKRMRHIFTDPEVKFDYLFFPFRKCISVFSTCS